MVDRETVLEGLGCCAHIAPQCSKCPYNEQRKRFNAGLGGNCTSFLHDNVLSILEDDAQIIRNYISVLQDITGNRMSKPNYTVSAVLDCVRQHYCDGCEEKREAVKPERKRSGGGTTWWYACGSCGTDINPRDKFCHECGREVKWDD